MLDEEGHCKLIDFGFAAKPDKEGLLHTNVGTPAYLSPEQLNHKKVRMTENKNTRTACSLQFAAFTVPRFANPITVDRWIQDLRRLLVLCVPHV